VDKQLPEISTKHEVHIYLAPKRSRLTGTSKVVGIDLMMRWLSTALHVSQQNRYIPKQNPANFLSGKIACSPVKILVTLLNLEIPQKSKKGSKFSLVLKRHL
jgi:hypothetical protein